ncbi:MAG: DNA polymerase III subunit gamma/tau [Clostridia bacterium]|nr:DNA polymerase III subunit gamma/tau [Clostridia bacterium]
MYRVLYRKWRPKLFSDIVGQDQVTVTLKNEITSSRLSHAYLFIGSRGTGKTSCAKVLAKAVNCLNLHDGNPCNECEICQGIDNGSIVDVVEIDAASNNRVDNIRDLREEVNYTPIKAKYRVYIIDEVHMLTTGAYNALLKTLEEPPAHVIFILATTEAHKVPATILSRCQRFDFNRITSDDISRRLKYVCEQEKFNIDDAAALLIARLADGAMRDALSILDQCAGKSEDITVRSVSETVGLIGEEHLFEISNAIYAEDTQALLSCIDALYSRSMDMERLCAELCNHFRNCMICKVSKEPQTLIACTVDEIERYRALASKFTASQLLYFIDKIRQTQDKLKFSLNRRVDMEVLFITLSKPNFSTDISAVISRIENLERSRGTISNVTPQVVAETNTNNVETPSTVSQETPVEPIKETTTPPCVDGTETETAEKPKTDVNNTENIPFDNWPEVLEEIKKVNKALFAVMVSSKAYIRGEYLLIDVANPSFRDYIKKNNLVSFIVDSVYQVCRVRYKIGICKNTSDDPPSQPTQPVDPLSGFVNNAKKIGFDVKFK